MDQQEIIRMARQVRDGGHWNQSDLIHFAALVAAAERKRCAQIVQSYMDSEYIDDPGWNVARDILNDIQGKKE